MPIQPQLNKRHQHILWATIRHYIATAEPVGSKTLLQEYDFSVSSATIRNCMGWLEKAGFLYQPHTSAGRIPSDSGYRIYVDRLITPDRHLGKQVEDLFSQNLQHEKGNIEAILQKATQILASLSGYIALITFPQNLSQVLHHLQLIRVGSGQIMLVIVTDSYQTHSIVIEEPLVAANDGDEATLIDEELQILSNFLNHKLKGRSPSDLAKLDWSELGREFQRRADFLNQILEELNCLHQPHALPQMIVKGVAELLRQPEFSQIEQVQMLLHLFEEKREQLLPLMFETPVAEKNSKGLVVTIGAENPLKPMHICTLIAANYHQDDTPVGSVGIIGPTRMLYENAIALVESTADYLTEALS